MCASLSDVLSCSPLHALCFGLGSGIAGVGILATQVNGLTAALGLTNIILYTSV